jgi:hypothetical protein
MKPYYIQVAEKMIGGEVDARLKGMLDRANTRLARTGGPFGVGRLDSVEWHLGASLRSRFAIAAIVAAWEATTGIGWSPDGPGAGCEPKEVVS